MLRTEMDTTPESSFHGEEVFNATEQIVRQDPTVESSPDAPPDAPSAELIEPLPKKSGAHYKEPGFRTYFELVVEVILFVFFINAFLLQTYVIPSPSMENSMLIGDHLVVDKVGYSRSISALDKLLLPQVTIERGMIVTFSGPSEINSKQPVKNLVKRVIALPGDTIRVKNNKVYINQQPTEEPYVVYKSGRGMPDFPPTFPNSWHPSFPQQYRKHVEDSPQGSVYRVPEDHYFCMGDNRNNSFDSRSWGPLPKNYIIGKPWRVYWSYSSIGSEYKQSGFQERVKDFFATLANFFTKTRWERTFKKY